MNRIRLLISSFFMMFSVLMLSSSFAYAGLDYCWKDSYGRGVGTIPYKCASGQETQGRAPFFTCYKQCPQGYSSTPLGGCMQTCLSSTYRDAFGNCVDNGVRKRYKNIEYTLVRNPDKCTIFDGDACFWKSCRKVHGQNGCEKYGAAIVAKCKKGYKRALLHCIPDLDCTGYVGKGVDAYGKTFCETKRKPPRAPQPADCGRGNVNDAGLCYKKCAAGSTGVGPVCWDKCPNVRGKQWVECGAGCAESAAACGLATTDMVLSVLDSAISIASLGSGSGITKLTKSTREGLTKGIKQAAKQYGKTFTKRFTSGYKKAVSGLTKEGMAKVGIVQDVVALQSTGRGVATFFGAVQEIVGQDISQEEMDFQIAQQALGYSSLFDPSGVMGVVAAYTKPLCSVLVSGSNSVPGTTDTAGTAGVTGAVGTTTAGAAEALMANNAELIKIVDLQLKGDQNDLTDLKKQKNTALISTKTQEIKAKKILLVKLRKGTGRKKPTAPTASTNVAGCAPTVAPTFSIDPNYYYTLSTAWQGANKVLTVSGDQAVLAPAVANQRTQLWKIERSSTGYYRLMAAVTGKTNSLDIHPSNKVQIRMAKTGNYSGQAWKISKYNANYYRLTTLWQGDCMSLDIVNDGTNNKTSLAKGGMYSGQAWKLTKTAIRAK